MLPPTTPCAQVSKRSRLTAAVEKAERRMGASHGCGAWVRRMGAAAVLAGPHHQEQHQGAAPEVGHPSGCGSGAGMPTSVDGCTAVPPSPKQQVNDLVAALEDLQAELNGLASRSRAVAAAQHTGSCSPFAGGAGTQHAGSYKPVARMAGQHAGSCSPLAGGTAQHAGSFDPAAHVAGQHGSCSPTAEVATQRVSEHSSAERLGQSVAATCAGGGEWSHSKGRRRTRMASSPSNSAAAAALMHTPGAPQHGGASRRATAGDVACAVLTPSPASHASTTASMATAPSPPLGPWSSGRWAGPMCTAQQCLPCMQFGPVIIPCANTNVHICMLDCPPSFAHNPSHVQLCRCNAHQCGRVC